MIKKNNICTFSYTLSILAISTMILSGCGGKSTPPPAQKTATTQSKPQEPIVSKPQAPSGLKIADLQGKGVVSSLGVKAKPEYKENEPIQFIVDTGGAEGYIYIVYLDSKGETLLLYPNKKAPEMEMGGEYMFPRDFGGMDIRATKDCSECKEEKTTVYVLFSQEPIVDIKDIKKEQLLSFAPSSQSKGLKMDLSDSGPVANLNVGVVEFVTK